ncbi:DsbA family protein [soil metagenome]
MKTSLRVALAFAAVLALSGCQKTADAAFGQKVRAYLLEHPEVIEEAVQKLQEKKVADAANIAKAGLVKYRKALERDSRDFVVNPNGKITVVEFFDYRCGYCKSSAPEIVKIIQENPDVRFVFKEFPIFGGESNLAAKVALTSAGKAKGLALYQTFMAEKALDEAAIDRHLSAAGIDPAQAKAAGESAAIAKQISDTHELAQSLGIEGTPAFIVGDKLVPGADMPALHAAIAAAKAGDVKAGN